MACLMCADYYLFHQKRTCWGVSCRYVAIIFFKTRCCLKFVFMCSLSVRFTENKHHNYKTTMILNVSLHIQGNNKLILLPSSLIWSKSIPSLNALPMRRVSPDWCALTKMCACLNFEARGTSVKQKKEVYSPAMLIVATCFLCWSCTVFCHNWGCFPF